METTRCASQTTPPSQDVNHIQTVVRFFPSLSRTELALTLSEHLGWYSASGAPKAEACLKLLEKLHTRGLIALPAKQTEKRHGPRRERPSLTARTTGESGLAGSLTQYAPARLKSLTDPADIGWWNEYVERYHPLGVTWPIGAWLRYFVLAERHRVGCVLVAGAAKALMRRDRWIVWDGRHRLRNLPWVINNTRFVLFPWFRIPHLASHVLGHMARRVGADWEAKLKGTARFYSKGTTFVDPAQWSGVSYRAAGWACLGQTTGRGLARPGRVYSTSEKTDLRKAAASRLSANVHERCNLGARHRWGIETGFLVEKHHGYSYEHCFAYHWNAMKGYHALMRLAHLLKHPRPLCLPPDEDHSQTGGTRLPPICAQHLRWALA